MYLANDNFYVITFGHRFTWLGIGNYESLADTTAFVEIIEKNHC